MSQFRVALNQSITIEAKMETDGATGTFTYQYDETVISVVPAENTMSAVITGLAVGFTGLIITESCGVKREYQIIVTETPDTGFYFAKA